MILSGFGTVLGVFRPSVCITKLCTRVLTDDPLDRARPYLLIVHYAPSIRESAKLYDPASDERIKSGNNLSRHQRVIKSLTSSGLLA